MTDQPKETTPETLAKSLTCLRLEVPGAIVDDIWPHVSAWKADRARLLEVERAAKELADEIDREPHTVWTAALAKFDAALRRLVEESAGPACDPYEGMTAEEKAEYLRGEGNDV